MTESKQAAGPEGHPLAIDPELCRGCVVCMRACPAKAIRVRRGVATIIPELCVDCGVCFRACPHGAIRLLSTPLDHIRRFAHPVATASPTIFSQFGYNVTPNQILLALKRVGFEQVVDISLICEMTAVAMEEYLLAHPGARPGISPLCPVVVKLITKRFPSLIEHVIPVPSPRMLAAKTIKDELAARRGWKKEDIGVFIISPCVAKIAGDRESHSSHLDGFICIHEVYQPILQALKDVSEDCFIHQESGRGLAWAMSGGQAEAFEESYTLSVSGFEEVVSILEMVEGGRLAELSFIEPHICQGGCVGGPLTVENRYRARSVVRHLIRRYGYYSRVDRSLVRHKMRQGFFDWGMELEPRPLPALAQDPSRAIERLKRINQLLDRLPGSQCGLCGSPDCATFAQDVIQGTAREEDCPALAASKGLPATSNVKDNMTVRDIAEQLNLEVAAGSEGLDRQVQGGYISDLLSDVIANAPAGCLWLTVQNHANSVAVAVLKDLAALCLVGGRRPQEDSAAKADQEKLPILLSPDDAYTLAGRLHELGLGR